MAKKKLSASNKVVSLPESAAPISAKEAEVIRYKLERLAFDFLAFYHMADDHLDANTEARTFDEREYENVSDSFAGMYRKQGQQYWYKGAYPLARSHGTR